MGRFPDGTLNGVLYDLEFVRDRNVLYLASFSSYERMYQDCKFFILCDMLNYFFGFDNKFFLFFYLSDASMVVLCQSFPSQVVILLPYFWR
jgi:hypothetical protein